MGKWYSELHGKLNALYKLHMYEQVISSVDSTGYIHISSSEELTLFYHQTCTFVILCEKTA
jgi:hypothetical protein